MKQILVALLFSVLFTQLCTAATVTTIGPSGAASVTYSFAAAGSRTGNYISILRGSEILSATISAVGARNVSARETADVTSGFGDGMSMVLATDGFLYVAYHDVTNGDLRLANQTAAGWVNGTIDTAGDVGTNPSMIQASDGNLYISYYDTTNGNLKLANQTGPATWVRGTIDTGGDVGWYSSMIQAADNNLYIAYSDSTNADLKLANQTGPATWVRGIIDPATDAWFWPVLMQGADGNLYIVYPAIMGGGGLTLANQTAGGWVIGTVSGTGGNFPSMIQASDGYFYISHFDGVGDLLLTNQTATGWVTGTVDAAGIVGWHSSMIQASDGNIYIAYSDHTTNGINLIQNSTGLIKTEIWISFTGLGIALGQTISLVEGTAQNLELAYRDGGFVPSVRYVSKSFPQNFVLNIGNTNALSAAVLNATSLRADIKNELVDYITNRCFTETCQVPIVVSTNSAGNATLSSLSVSYNPPIPPPVPAMVVAKSSASVKKSGTETSGETGGTQTKDIAEIYEEQFNTESMVGNEKTALQIADVEPWIPWTVLGIFVVLAFFFFFLEKTRYPINGKLQFVKWM